MLKEVLLKNQIAPFCKIRLVELVDTSDLKSDSNKSIGSIPITDKFFKTKMMELVDMLGLGSSSSWNRGSSPLFGKKISHANI
jgi:hypothetical protein